MIIRGVSSGEGNRTKPSKIHLAMTLATSAIPTTRQKPKISARSKRIDRVSEISERVINRGSSDDEDIY